MANIQKKLSCELCRCAYSWEYIAKDSLVPANIIMFKNHRWRNQRGGGACVPHWRDFAELFSLWLCDFVVSLQKALRISVKCKCLQAVRRSDLCDCFCSEWSLNFESEVQSRNCSCPGRQFVYKMPTSSGLTCTRSTIATEPPHDDWCVSWRTVVLLPPCTLVRLVAFGYEYGHRSDITS